MAKYRGPRAKISRKFGAPILGCEDVLKKKRYPPGQHGKKHKRKSEYAQQLAEKQKAKYTYGLLERQFRNLVKKAASQRGISGDILMQLLEMRLDKVVYRLGICPTTAAARQFVVHRHILVNGKVVDRPSYTLKKDDIISLSEKAKVFEIVKNSLQKDKRSFSWLAWDNNQMRGIVLNIPARQSIPENINEKVIIEFYAR